MDALFKMSDLLPAQTAEAQQSYAREVIDDLRVLGKFAKMKHTLIAYNGCGQVVREFNEDIVPMQAALAKLDFTSSLKTWPPNREALFAMTQSSDGSIFNTKSHRLETVAGIPGKVANPATGLVRFCPDQAEAFTTWATDTFA